MKTIAPNSLGRRLAVAATALVAACTDGASLAPDGPTEAPARVATPTAAEYGATLATLRRVTARYHDLNAAIADDFVFLHGCEYRPGEGTVGTVYIHVGRLMDGLIDPAAPDGLIYEPGPNGVPTLAAVELAVPYALWTGAEPPRFLGATFQSEDEFGVYGLHAWVWRDNPEGMFAESNPRVSCGIN